MYLNQFVHPAVLFWSPCWDPGQVRHACHQEGRGGLGVGTCASSWGQSGHPAHSWSDSALYVGHLIKLVVGQLHLLEGDNLGEVPVKVLHLGEKNFSAPKNWLHSSQYMLGPNKVYCDPGLRWWLKRVSKSLSKIDVTEHSLKTLF